MPGRLVFTNGCFDLLHPGHVDLLKRARQLGDRLVVGLNSDSSVCAIKGPGRPFVPQEDRAVMLRALRCVDEVILFEEPTPARIIEQLLPDVLVKGGDWPPDQIVGADVVLRNNGRVVSLPLLPLYSTSALVERICQSDRISSMPRTDESMVQNGALSGLAESILVERRLLSESGEAILKTGRLFVESLSRGGRIILFGNGGSGAIAQLIASELNDLFVGLQQTPPAITLIADGSPFPAMAEDHEFERVFACQIEALANPEDTIVAISTSGSSANVLTGVMAAVHKRRRVIGLTGIKGKKLASLCEAAILVPSESPSRVQEAHLTIGHLWCCMAEASISGGVGR